MAQFIKASGRMTCGTGAGSKYLRMALRDQGLGSLERLCKKIDYNEKETQHLWLKYIKSKTLVN